MTKLCTLTAVFIVLASPAWGTNYYVATTGNDTTGDGSSGNPWQTIQRSVQSGSPVTAGDTVYVRDGTYTAATGNTRTVLINGTGTPQGTSGNPVTIRAENCYAATVVVPSVSGASAIAFYVNRQYITIECFTITGNLLSGNHPIGTSMAGVFLESSAVGATIRNNRIHSIGRNVCTDSLNAFSGVFTRGASTQLIQDNTIYTIGRRFNGELGCVNSTGSDNDHGIYVEHANNLTIRRNVFYDVTRGYAVHVYKSGQADPPAFVHTNLTIDHNTFDTPAGETRGPSAQMIYGQTITGFNVRNNIFSRPEVCPITTFNPGTFTSVSFIGNRTDKNDADFHCSGNLPAGITVGATNTYNVSLGFTNLSTNTYTLAAGSASIDTGQNIGDSFIGAAPDPGAYEFQGTGKTRYVSASGSDSNTCADSENINTPKLTFASAVACLNAGDTLYIRGGTWTQRIDLQNPSKTGTSSGWITIAGYPGETVTIRYTDSVYAGYGPIRARGARGYFIFENLILDGSTSADEVKWQIRDGNHHFILRNVEIKGFPTSALYIQGNNITITHCKLHDSSGPQNLGYGIYWNSGNDGVVEHTEIYNQPGGGVQAYPGPINNLHFRHNYIHDNNQNTTKAIGGIIVANEPTHSPPQPVTNVFIYSNIFSNNGSHATAGSASGVRVDGTTAVSNIKVFNNVMYGNKTQGFRSTGPTTGLELRNNIITNNGTVNSLGSFTASHNACTSGETCGSTGKVTLTSVETCTVSTSDFRLKQGTNPCRNAGTAVSTRLSLIGLTDIGPYEQGEVIAAAVVSGFVEATVSVVMGGLIPSTGISGFTVACVGCTGTPSVSAATIVSGTVIRLTIIGITSNGTCTISLGSSNLKDSGYVGPSSLGYSQYVNSVSGLAVSGTCQNTEGGGTSLPGTPYIVYEFDDNLSDTSGNNLHIVNSSGTSFVTAKHYKGLKTDLGQNDYAEIPYFSGVNPSTQSLTIAGGVYIDPADVCQLHAVGGTDPGVNQYFHLYYSGCTWKMLIQDNAVVNTEFSVQSGWNHVCINLNAATDTATMYINRTPGAVSGGSVQTYTSFNFAGNFRIGRFVGSGLAAGPNHIYDRWVVYTSVEDCTQIYDNWEPPSGTWTGTLSMVAGRFYMAKTDPAGALIPLAPANNTNITLPPGAAAGVALQTDCTTANCSAIGQRLYYSCAACPSGGTEMPVPDSASTDGVRLWGGSLESGLLSGAQGANLAGALAHTSGGTHLTASSVLVVDLPQNGSTVERWLVVIEQWVAEGKTFCFKAKEQTGTALNGYTPSGGICLTTGMTSANVGP